MLDGGPAGGAAVAILWASIDQGMSSDEAADQATAQRGSSPGATVVSKNGGVIAAQDSKKLPTGDECWDKFTKETLSGIVGSATVKDLVANFMIAIGFDDPPVSIELHGARCRG